MRFTPSEDCQVLKGKVYSYIGMGSSQTCYLSIHDNESGKPGTIRFETSYMPTHDAWDEVSITSTVTYDTDFWVVFQIPVGSLSGSIWMISDESVGYANRNVTKKDASSSWEIPSPVLYGDICIRAIVSPTGVEEAELSSSETVVLEQNYPNPFVKETAISYTLSQKMNVELKIYDITGKLVKVLVDGTQEIGLKKAVWDRRNAEEEVVQSGVYFYRLKTDTDYSFTKVMIVF